MRHRSPAPAPAPVQDLIIDISQIIFKSNPTVPKSHRHWISFPSAAIRQSNLGDSAVLGSPSGQFCRHPDTPLPSFLPRRGCPRPTPEQVFVADHRSGPGFSGIGLSILPPRPVGRWHSDHGGRPWRRATSFSRSVVSDQYSASLGSANVSYGSRADSTVTVSIRPLLGLKRT